MTKIDLLKWCYALHFQEEPKEGCSPGVAKGLLAYLCFRANRDLIAYPKVQKMSEDTLYSLRNIARALNFLLRIGVIEDTGERKGRTGVTVVWRINADDRADPEAPDDFVMPEVADDVEDPEV